ncbi:MAG: hypothetical protein NTY91_04760 [Euryarchaeota archaeon]|nr:hypothetical protein [Euryarchaeota archaeon]
MVNTLNHARAVFSHRKNKGCTSWIFLIVFSSFFFLLKHKKRRFVDPRDDLTGTTAVKEFCDQTTQISGVGDE